MLLAKDHSKKCTDAAEDDGMPLQLNLHPQDGEGRTAHSLEKAIILET